MIASCLNASHSFLNSSSFIASFIQYATIEELIIESLDKIYPVLSHPKSAIVVDRSAFATRVLSMEMEGRIMSPLFSRYESSFNLYDLS